ASSGGPRGRGYRPGATIVGACSSAATGLGPAIARDSQKLTGSCADLPSAASTTPAAITVSHGCVARDRPPSARLLIPPATPAPAATYKPRSAARVTRNAVAPPATRSGSRHP